MSILLCFYLNMIRVFCWFNLTLNRCFSGILGVTACFKDHTQLCSFKQSSFDSSPTKICHNSDLYDEADEDRTQTRLWSLWFIFVPAGSQDRFLLRGRLNAGRQVVNWFKYNTLCVNIVVGYVVLSVVIVAVACFVLWFWFLCNRTPLKTRWCISRGLSQIKCVEMPAGEQVQTEILGERTAPWQNDLTYRGKLWSKEQIKYSEFIYILLSPNDCNLM